MPLNKKQNAWHHRKICLSDPRITDPVKTENSDPLSHAQKTYMQKGVLS